MRNRIIIAALSAALLAGAIGGIAAAGNDTDAGAKDGADAAVFAK